MDMRFSDFKMFAYAIRVDIPERIVLHTFDLLMGIVMKAASHIQSDQGKQTIRPQLQFVFQDY